MVQRSHSIISRLIRAYSTLLADALEVLGLPDSRTARTHLRSIYHCTYESDVACVDSQAGGQPVLFLVFMISNVLSVFSIMEFSYYDLHSKATKAPCGAEVVKWLTA